MQKRWLIPIAVVAALALAAVGAACGDDDGDGGGNGEEPTATVAEGETPQEGATVDVNLTEYIVSPDPASAPAGSITFNASNIGGTDHELVILKTDLPADGLPTNEDGSADEAGEGVEAIDEIEEFAAGGEESLTVTLEAGNYVLFCNVVQTAADGSIVAHYAEGMTTEFEVTE
jgi:hypothetical protein